MNARLERKLRVLGVTVAASAIGGIVFVLAQGYTSPISIAEGISYGLILSLAIGGVSLFVLEGPMRMWLGGLSFPANLAVRTAIYAAIIIPTQYFQLGAVIIGQPFVASMKGFWIAMVFSVVFLVVINLVLGISNIIGPRAFLNFFIGRYHTPVEENRFVLFVDIAGSTGLAERLGGIAIHRLLDRTFRLLTVAVVDYRGEVLNYVGDEVIVTWKERSGAVDCRPLRCFVAMREELTRASSQLEREFGAAPRIRGSLHFGPVIVGEIGDVKRAIVFNGDVMNTAARLEELSRNVEGGFLASRAAMQRFNSAPPFAVRDLGRLAIRGRADGIDVVGIGAQS
ncbi:MAG: adenylate/guanylate cyclase domain-containing protein [Bradyrhizobium sp.]|uniref:adenylate/guanylate cyclase domain-containing protein n=1 Tax=Bradyrhizobium sp. TaxID=376 RepID=UPI0011FB54E5|nr:adenylate/guanylate cyclase domain-containing protein [Bradyrhizobium sp.]THD65623.1 MAG: adenylate/guanylate cyclase domain-containing protein [Bradyrhizobium sp.]